MSAPELAAASTTTVAPATPPDTAGRLRERRGVAPDVEQRGGLAELARQRRGGGGTWRQHRRAQPRERREGVAPRVRRARARRGRGGTAHTGGRGESAVG